MDTRRSRHPSPSDTLAAFRWLGWVMLMMFVLVQTVRAAGGDAIGQNEVIGPQARERSQASAQVEPGTHQVKVEAPAPATLWNMTPGIDAR